MFEAPTPPLSPVNSMPPQPPVPPNNASPKPVMPAKFRGKLPIILAIAVILVIAVGASAFYYFYYFAASPERVFGQALDNLKNLQSGTVNYQVSFGYTPKEQTAIDKAVTFLGAMDSQNINFKINAKTDFAKKIDFVAVNTELAFDIPTGMQIPMVGSLTVSPILDAIYADKENLYVKIKGIPVLPMMDLSSVNDKWIKVNFKELQDQYGFKIDSTQNEQNIKKASEWRDKVIAAYNKNSFFKLTKLGDETVDSENSYHFNLALDKELFKNFSSQLEQQALSDKTIDASSSAQYLKDVDEQLKSVDFSGEVWIGKKSRVFKKVSVLINVNNDSGTFKVSQLAAITNYNKSVAIAAPADSVSFKEVLSNIMGSASLEFDQNASTTISINGDDKVVADKTLADIKGIQTALELYYDANKKYPLPPIGGKVLGLNAICLGKIGFGAKLADCQNPYLRNITMSPSQIDSYNYYLCSNDSYVITFFLPADAAGVRIGSKVATPKGIFDYISTASASAANKAPSLTDDCQDPDKDGLPNFAERKYGTNDLKADTDGDGFLDGAEVLSGYNPNSSGKL